MIFNREFFYDTPNHLVDFLPEDENLIEALHIIRVEDYHPGCLLNLVIDSEAGQAVAYLDSNAEDA